MNTQQPRIAIVDANTLAALGLKQLLLSLIPVLEVNTFRSFAELMANSPECHVHFFVAMNIVLENRAFFTQHRQKTIVLTVSADGSKQLSDFHCICVNVSEAELVRSLLILEQHAHGSGKHLPPRRVDAQVLTGREAEVMALIVKGFINKEIADMLHISLATVVTHRKNIMEKLGIKSVSALTIYAVMNGYVDINKI